MKHSLFLPAAILPLLLSLPQCSRKPLLPEYTPLCAGMVPGKHTSPRALQARENRTYRVGPKGGVYYINSHNKKSTSNPGGFNRRPRKHPVTFQMGNK